MTFESFTYVSVDRVGVRSSTRRLFHVAGPDMMMIKVTTTNDDIIEDSMVYGLITATAHPLFYYTVSQKKRANFETI